jgi:hypothetical protein
MKTDPRPASVRLARFLKRDDLLNVRAAESNGHALLSQGCMMFRCAHCPAQGYMDADLPTAFREPCKHN